MKKKLVALTCGLAMAASMLAACGSGSGGASQASEASSSAATEQASVNPTANTLKRADVQEMTYLYQDDVSDWNYLTTTNNTPAEYIDSLVEYDYLGICQPCLAESWERSDDGLTWTFHIRKGVKWMTYDQKEYADVTANDWVTSCKYILDPDNASALVDMMFTIKGAEDYYNAKVAGEDPSFDEVGVKALDDYTLQYTLESATPYFLSSLTYKNFFPANQQWIDEQGDSFSTDNQTMLYCGEYIMTDYEPQRVIESVLNPTYWDKDNMHITAIHEIYNSEADTVAPEMFLRGETNYAEIPTDQLDEWLNNPDRYDQIRPSRPGFYTRYYNFCFNPCFDEKYEPDNWKIAVNNLDFRKSIYYAIDKLSLIQVEDPYNAEDHLQNTQTPADFVAADGVDYTQLDPLKDIASEDTYNLDKAKEYADKAKEEIKAAGGHLPVIVFVPYDAGDVDDTQRVQVLEQMLERNLGSDYIDIQTEGYPDDGFSQATNRSCNFAFMRNTWLADYQDPMAYTDPLRIYQNRGNCIYMADGMGTVCSADTEGAIKSPYPDRDGNTNYYTDLVLEGKTAEANAEVVDINARYNKLAEVEAYLLDQAYVIPYMRSGTGYVASKLMPFESQFAPFGASDGRYKYQWVYDEGINTDQYNEAYKEWQQERADKLKELSDAGKVFGVDY